MKETKIKPLKHIFDCKDYEVFKLDGFYGFYAKHPRDTQHRLEVRHTLKEAQKDAKQLTPFDKS